MTPGETSDSHEQLVAEVYQALLGIRSAKGRLTPQKLAQFPVLVSILGGDDLLDAFMAFRRELRRIVATANRDEAAAALSIYIDEENVLDRLQQTANQLGETEETDQRSARRWSDRGMPPVAQDLVYMAEVQGRLGREMLSIELHDADRGGLMILIDQIVQDDLDVRPPDVTLWAVDESGDPRELTVRLATYPMATTTADGHRMTRQRVLLAPELLDHVTVQHGLTVAVTGRDAPMRTISFVSEWTPRSGIGVAMSAYRSRASVELSCRSTSAGTE